MTESTTIVIGVGNPLRRDDGIGPEIIKRLVENDCAADLWDGGTDGFTVLDKIQHYQRAIIIDAVDMGAAPGTVKLFAPSEARLVIKNDALTTHGFGLAEILNLAQQLQVTTELTIIGIQPENIDYGEGLSVVVATKIEEIIANITNLLAA